MVVMAAFPIPQIRDIVFRWAMFLAAYNGRGIFTFWYSFHYIIAHSPLRTLPPCLSEGGLSQSEPVGRCVGTHSVGLLTTIMGPLGVLAGILAMLVGAMHLMMYVYFRDIIEEDYKKSTVSSPLPFLFGCVGRSVVVCVCVRS
jgi:hypothetical protein